jgi:hypothetical protein
METVASPPKIDKKAQPLEVPSSKPGFPAPEEQYDAEAEGDENEGDEDEGEEGDEGEDESEEDDSDFEESTKKKKKGSNH